MIHGWSRSSGWTLALRWKYSPRCWAARSAGWPRPPLPEPGSRWPHTEPYRWRNTGWLCSCWPDPLRPTRRTPQSLSVRDKSTPVRRRQRDHAAAHGGGSSSRCFCSCWVSPAPSWTWRCCTLLGWSLMVFLSAGPPGAPSSPVSEGPPQASSAVYKALLFEDVPGGKPGQTQDLRKQTGHSPEDESPQVSANMREIQFSTSSARRWQVRWSLLFLFGGRTTVSLSQQTALVNNLQLIRSEIKKQEEDLYCETARQTVIPSVPHQKILRLPWSTITTDMKHRSYMPTSLNFWFVGLRDFKQSECLTWTNLTEQPAWTQKPKVLYPNYKPPSDPFI